LTAGDINIGRDLDNSALLSGYISNVRIVKGTAVYTSAFTPPTAPLTAITNTQLLTCQSNRFVDNSTNNFTITRVGDTRISPFQPFTLAANDNGSGYFDGTDGTINVSNIAFTGNFTFECLYYPEALGSGVSTNYSVLFGEFTTSNLQVYVNTNGSISYYNGTSNIIVSSTGLVTVGQWHHIALVRSGTTTTMYLNGSSVGSATDSGTRSIGAIGNSFPSTPNYGVRGYVSNARFVSSAIVPPAGGPTSPLTNVTNTQLLTCQYSGTVRNVGFIDSSPYDFPITRVGNTTQGTFSPFSLGAGMWSNYFDGSIDWLSVTYDATAFGFGTNNLTIEAWIYPVSFSTFPSIFSQRGASAGITFRLDSSGKPEFYYAGGTGYFTASTGAALNTWSHVALTREGNVFKLWLNGQNVGTSGTITASMTNAINVAIGRSAASAVEFYAGYLSNLRVVNGRAVYTSNFTPSTVPLGVTSGGQNPPQGTETSLLTCQANRLVDSSTTPRTVTDNATTEVRAFFPFAPTAAYDPAVNGGSGYFDGSGDYLRRGTSLDPAFDFGSGNFTIEMFVYHVALKNYSGLIGEVPGTTNNTINFYTFADGTVGATLLGVGQQMASSAGVARANAWQHFALVRNSGVTTLYVDGVSRATYSSSANMAVGGSAGIGIGSTHGTGDLNGYISNLRILKGVAQYTANFTPPTAPLTAITNTSLLLNFANAGILDQTGKTVLDTVGNAQVDTNVKKFGMGSMKFDGTGDYLLVPHSNDHLLGPAPFTIEMWVNPDSIGLKAFIGKGVSGSTGWAVGIDSSGRVVFYYSNSSFNSTGSISASTWTHIAVVRTGINSNETKIYINGSNDGTGTVGFDFTQTEAMYIGSGRGGNGLLNGYIDDLRITKGVARYTANFTPPAQAFPDK
jgi:hypothetical protein